MYYNRLKTIREEKGLTLEKLSKLSGVSAGYLCHLERGTRSHPSIDIMESIAKALDKTIFEVFFNQ